MKVADILEEQDHIEDEPTYVTPDTAEVAQHVYPFLVQRIEKINKRARKNKLPEIKLEKIKEYTKKIEDTDQHGVGIIKQIPYYTIKVSGDAPKIAGYKFIATIEHQEGGNIIRSVPGEEGNEKIKDFFEAKPHYCDHCKKIRRRVDTFIVKEEKTGKLRQIGRNCLADFLGGADPKVILWYFNNRDNIFKVVQEAEQAAEKKGIRGDMFVPLDQVLIMAAALVREFGYLSSKAAEEAYRRDGSYMPTTSGDVRWLLYGTKQDLDKRSRKVLDVAKTPTEADRQYVAKVLKWFNELPDQQKQSNEFMHNLDVIVKSDKVNPRNIGFAVALFPVYERAMDNIKKREVSARKSNEWIGQPGQKLTPTDITVIRTRMISGHFGSTQIVSMEDPKGNILVWFNNSQNRFEEGDKAKIVGTIKKHDEYNGRKQTHLTRVKTV